MYLLFHWPQCLLVVLKIIFVCKVPCSQRQQEVIRIEWLHFLILMKVAVDCIKQGIQKLVRGSGPFCNRTH